MSDVVIKSENLGKKYTIGHRAKNGRYVALRDVLVHNAKNLWHKTKDLVSGKPIIQGDTTEEVWALKDLNFEIKRGEAVGIIGRNGAGKSTLLKILSRITEPTTGRVTIDGRVASLLEVGTGFHPELTGRENIYLNGTILGMTRAEIRRKFDEIVAFAEIEKYLDTPVKRYSSGMYVRLAFAVAAHLEPEILVVDEVLAVGDSEFQKKCLGKMDDVTKQQGRTVLFVSHNLTSIENLCKTGIVLSKGNLLLTGSVDKAISSYIRMFIDHENETEVRYRKDRKGEGKVRLTSIDLEDENSHKNIAFPIGSDIFFKINYETSAPIKNPRIILGIYDFMNIGITRFDTDITMGLPFSIPNKGTIICRARNASLTPGRYYVNIAFFSNNVLEDYLTEATFFNIIGSDYFNTGRTFNENDSKLTKILLEHDWKYYA